MRAITLDSSNPITAHPRTRENEARSIAHFKHFLFLKSWNVFWEMGASLLLCDPTKAIWTNHQEKKRNKITRKNQKTLKTCHFRKEKCIFNWNSGRAYKKVRVCKIWWVFVERIVSKHQKRSWNHDCSICSKVFCKKLP